MKVSVDHEKYTVISEGGVLKALRHGKPWRDLCGDKLVFHLAYELHECREKLAKVKSAIELTEELCEDQSNGMTDGSICISAMKDIRRHVK